MTELQIKFPCFRKSGVLQPFNNEKMLYSSASTTLLLGGSISQDILPHLIPLLDGSRTIVEIMAEMHTFHENEVRAALNFLFNNGLLTDESRDKLPPNIVNRYNSQINFFSGYTMQNPYEKQNILTTSTISIVGVGDVGSSIISELAGAGIGKIRFFDTKSDIGHKLTDQSLFPDTVLEPYLGNENMKSLDFRNFFNDTSLAIVFANRFEDSFIRSINNFAIDNAMPWLLCRLDGSGCTAGPLFIPRETCCYTCYCNRRRGVQDNIETHDILTRNYRPENYDRIGVIPGLPLLTASIVVVETIKYLTQVDIPACVGSEMRYNFSDSSITNHSVLKLPRCPDCGPERLHNAEPAMWMTAPWDE